MKNDYVIEKDNVLKCWIIWENHKNYKVEVYRSELKKNCKEWIRKKNKDGKEN